MNEPRSWIQEIRDRLASPPPRRLAASDLRQAAVLVPLYVDAGELWTVLTRRAADLPTHRSQIAFPGGGRELKEDPWGAAVREAHEEIGLEPTRVEVLGELDAYDTVTGVRIHPIVGWIEPPVELVPDPFEVAEVFELPLAFALDPENHRRDSYLREGRTRHVYVLPYQERYIWGATAGILVNFARRLGAAPP